jgi:hypothetical protein
LVTHFIARYGHGWGPRLVELPLYVEIAVLALLPAIARWISPRLMLPISFGGMAIGLALLIWLRSPIFAMIALGIVGVLNIGTPFVHDVVPKRAHATEDLASKVLICISTLGTPIVFFVITAVANRFHLAGGLAMEAGVMLVAFGLSLWMIRGVKIAPTQGGFARAWTPRARRVALLAVLLNFAIGINLGPIAAILQHAGWIDRDANPNAVWVLAVTATGIVGGAAGLTLTNRMERLVDAGLRLAAVVNLAGTTVLLITMLVPHGWVWMALELIGIALLFLGKISEGICYGRLEGPAIEKTVVNVGFAGGFIGGMAIGNVAVINLGIPYQPIAMASAVLALIAVATLGRKLHRREILCLDNGASCTDDQDTSGVHKLPVPGGLLLEFGRFPRFLVDGGLAAPVDSDDALVPCVIVNDRVHHYTLDWRNLELSVLAADGSHFATVRACPLDDQEEVRRSRAHAPSPYGLRDGRFRGPQTDAEWGMTVDCAHGVRVDVRPTPHGHNSVTFPEATSFPDGTARLAAAWRASRPSKGVGADWASRLQSCAAARARGCADWLSLDARLRGMGPGWRGASAIVAIAACAGLWMRSIALAGVCAVGIAWVLCGCVVALRRRASDSDAIGWLVREKRTWLCAAAIAGCAAVAGAAGLVFGIGVRRLDGLAGLIVAVLVSSGLITRIRGVRDQLARVRRMRRAAWEAIERLNGAVRSVAVSLHDTQWSVRADVACPSASNHPDLSESKVIQSILTEKLGGLIPHGHQITASVRWPLVPPK